MILKGIALGFGIFIFGLGSYGLLRIGLAAHKVSQLARSGGVAQSGGTNMDIRGLIHLPYVWIALFLSFAVGIWIMQHFRK